MQGGDRKSPRRGAALADCTWRCAGSRPNAAASLRCGELPANLRPRLFNRAAEGTAERALFVLDEQGVIRWGYVSDYNVNPGADGILEALEALPGSRS